MRDDIIRPHHDWIANDPINHNTVRSRRKRAKNPPRKTRMYGPPDMQHLDVNERSNVQKRHREYCIKMGRYVDWETYCDDRLMGPSNSLFARPKEQIISRILSMVR